MKHTPGPWINLGNGDIVARSENYCGGEKDIASVFLTSNDEDEANANLIAAAPDLLEALKDMLDGHEDACTGYGDGAADKARAAIAKATGEQP
jgi:hypothetical protein